jgi:hypothetical protein
MLGGGDFLVCSGFPSDRAGPRVCALQLIVGGRRSDQRVGDGLCRWCEWNERTAFPVISVPLGCIKKPSEFSPNPCHTRLPMSGQPSSTGVTDEARARCVSRRGSLTDLLKPKSSSAASTHTTIQVSIGNLGKTPISWWRPRWSYWLENSACNRIAVTFTGIWARTSHELG